MKKLIALLLALLMVSVLFVSCSNENGNEDTTTAAADTAADTEPEETEDPTIILEIPAEHNYGGKDFVLYTWSNQTQWEWDSEGTNGETMNDAIWSRRIKTEELLGVKIVLEKQIGDWDNRNSFIAKLDANVSTNLHSFDAVSQYTPAAGIGAIKKLYKDLMDIETLHTEKKWWPGDITESAAVNGRLYFITGDITPTLIRNMSCVMANLEMCEQYQLPDIYELVDNKQWTLEKFEEIATGHVASLNGNGEEKYYGVTISNNVTYDGLFYSGAFKFVEANPDGTLVMSPDLYGEDIITWFDAAQKFLFGHEDVELLAVNTAFTSGHAIFHLGQSSDIQNYMRDVTFQFGIAPFPIRNPEQDGYHTISGYWNSMFSIPIDVSDEQMSGTVLEVLGYFGYDVMTPAFYIDSFQYKFLNSAENARMFDLLHDTMTYDTGRFYADAINCFAAFRKACTQDMTWKSYFEGQKTMWEKGVQNVYDTLG